MSNNNKKPLFINFSGYPINPQTVSGITQVMSNAVNQGRDDITLLFSTPGGSTREGISLYNFIKGLPINIRTWNIGGVESIGNVIFAAGDERVTTTTSSFFFHDVRAPLNGKSRVIENDLNEILGIIKRDRRLIVEVLTKETSIPSERLDDWFASGNSIRGDEAVELGVAHEIKDVEIPESSEVITLGFN